MFNNVNVRTIFTRMKPFALKFIKIKPKEIEMSIENEAPKKEHHSRKCNAEAFKAVCILVSDGYDLTYACRQQDFRRECFHAYLRERATDAEKNLYSTSKHLRCERWIERHMQKVHKCDPVLENRNGKLPNSAIVSLLDLGWRQIIWKIAIDAPKKYSNKRSTDILTCVKKWKGSYENKLQAIDEGILEGNITHEQAKTLTDIISTQARIEEVTKLREELNLIKTNPHIQKLLKKDS